MGTKIYHEEDGDLSVLKNKVIGMIGYGNQGRSQALNMRDQGINVIVGNRDDEFKVRAEEDGFETYSIPEAVQKGDIFFLLIPDEIMNEVYEKKIEPYLSNGDALAFASGYNIAFDLLKPPQTIDVLLIAPRMIGVGVRETFLNKEGHFSFIGVHQNASGQAEQIMLALTKGVGGLMKGGVEVTMMQEAVLDLFSEQGFGPSFSQIMLKSINLLLDAGYPKETVLVELILSGWMKYSYDDMAKIGIIDHIKGLSPKNQYGSLSRVVRFQDVIHRIITIQKDILRNIQNGSFAEEWEKVWSKIKFKILKFFAPRVGIGKIEKAVRENLKMPEIDIWEEVPLPTMQEVERNLEIRRELEDFRNYEEF
jgi:ketol-acid reductoisomerase